MAKKVQCDGCDKLEDASYAETIGWDHVVIMSDKLGQTNQFDLCQTCHDIFYRNHVPRKWERSK